MNDGRWPVGGGWGGNRRAGQLEEKEKGLDKKGEVSLIEGSTVFLFYPCH